MQKSEGSVLIVSATALELSHFLNQRGLPLNPQALGLFKLNPTLELLITGPGLLPMLALCVKQMVTDPPRTVINAGFSGLYPTSSTGIAVGAPTLTLHERVHPYGILRDNRVLPIAASRMREPVESAIIPATTIPRLEHQVNFPCIEGITLTAPSARTAPPETLNIQGPCSESMEAAACAYACNLLGIPLITLRIISNYTPEVNPSQWPIPALQKNMHEALDLLLSHTFQ